MSGGGSPDTITQSSAPPAYAEPYHKSLMQGAGAAASQPYSPYPGPQIPGFNPEQESALNAATARGMGGSPVDLAAQQQNMATSQGAYLDPNNNPSYQNALDYGQRQVMQNYGAQLGRNFGNSGVNQMVGQGMGQVSGALYDAERNRMMQAGAMAPSLSELDYRDIQAVMGAGDARQGLMQQQLGAPTQAWQQAQTWPSYGQGLLGGAIGATGGYGSQTSPNPYQSNPMAGAISGGTLGYMGASSGAFGTAAAANPWLGAGLGAAALYMANR